MRSEARSITRDNRSAIILVPPSCAMTTGRSGFALLILLGFFAGGWAMAGLVPGKIYPLTMVDVDGRTLSTTDGHVTVLVLTGRAEAEKARLLGDRIPERCLGNPAYRMITVIRLERNWSRRMRFLPAAMIRRRLDAEAKRLQPKYA